jgi:hypothetical protein
MSALFDPVLDRSTRSLSARIEQDRLIPAATQWGNFNAEWSNPFIRGNLMGVARHQNLAHGHHDDLQIKKQ